MTEREVSSERVSEERLEEMLQQLVDLKPGPVRMAPGDVPELISGLSELLALRSSVGVKKLEWVAIEAARSDEDPRTEETGDYEATTPFGVYSIEMGFGSDEYVWLLSFDDVLVEGARGGNDPEKLMAAAQADYERRILSAIEAPSEGETVRDPWVDTRLVRFDDTVQFGHGGFDFDRWEGLRSEIHTRHGSFAVWKSGDRSWSMYGGKYGVMALDRYSCEEHAKADAEQYLLSLDNEAPAAPSEVTEEMVEADRARLVHILVVHFDMFRARAEEIASLFLHDKSLTAALKGDRP